MSFATEEENYDYSEELQYAIDKCRDEETAAVDLAKFAAARDKVRRLVEKVVSQARVNCKLVGKRLSDTLI